MVKWVRTNLFPNLVPKMEAKNSLQSVRTALRSQIWFPKKRWMDDRHLGTVPKELHSLGTVPKVFW